jgi:hypothetical protein
MIFGTAHRNCRYSELGKALSTLDSGVLRNEGTYDLLKNTLNFKRSHGPWFG